MFGVTHLWLFLTCSAAQQNTDLAVQKLSGSRDSVTHGKMSSAQSYVFLFLILPGRLNSKSELETEGETGDKCKLSVEVKVRPSIHIEES